jgi:hypothetical protein
MIDAATKSVTPKQKKAKIKAFLDEFRDQIKGKCDGQNVEYGGLKTYLTQKQANGAASPKRAFYKHKVP